MKRIGRIALLQISTWDTSIPNSQLYYIRFTPLLKLHTELNKHFFCCFSELPSPTLSHPQVWHEGDGGSFICSSFTGDLWAGSLMFRWQKDGRDIFSIPGVIVIHNPTAKMSILEFKRLSAGDSGEYTCIASNRAGKTSVSADIVVYGLCPVKNLIRKFFIECKSSSGFWLEQLLSNIFSWDFKFP